MKAMLLRVGIDTGTDGALAPIFDNGSFEFIPISEGTRSRESATYANTVGRSSKPFSTYLPMRIHQRQLHNDPEFKTFTYGDPTGKRKYLLKLGKDDLLVFYAGLKPYETERYEKALYIIGYFTVSQIIDFNRLTEKETSDCYRQYSHNAHLKRYSEPQDLVLVVGDEKRSKLFDTAILISRRKRDKRGRPYHAVSSEMEKMLGISGSIQRSIPPRFIGSIACLKSLNNIINMD